MLGMTLAYAEMYIAIATIYRRCEFELFETTKDAVDCWKNMFVPHPKPSTLKVRAVQVYRKIEFEGFDFFKGFFLRKSKGGGQKMVGVGNKDVSKKAVSYSQ